MTTATLDDLRTDEPGSTDAPAGATPGLADDVADLLFRTARTVHTFSDEPVSDDELAAAYELARWAPTAMNTSPLRLLVVRSEDARARLAQHMAPGNKDRALAASPLSLVAAADTAFHQHLPLLAPHAAAMVDSLEAEPEKRVAMARQPGLIQVGYLITALRAVGLAVGPVGGYDADALDADLLAGTGWRSLLVLHVGHPAAVGASHPRAPRLTFDQVNQVV